jgi:hypothetical protein
MGMGSAECAGVLEEMERERARLLGELGAWTAARLGFRPAEGGWSAVEVLDHIVLAEAGTTEDMRETLKALQVLGDEARPKVAELERALRSEQRFILPTGAGIEPDAGTDFAEVVRRWDVARGELGLMVEGLSDEEARCGVFCHPFAGWMTMGEVLGHMGDHLYHHEFQLERLRENSASLQEAS